MQAVVNILPSQTCGPEASTLFSVSGACRSVVYWSFRGQGITRFSPFLYSRVSGEDGLWWSSAWRGQDQWILKAIVAVHSHTCIHYSLHVNMNYMAVFTRGLDCFLNEFFFFLLDLFWGSSEKSMRAGVVSNAMSTVALHCSFFLFLSLSFHAPQSKYHASTNNSPLCVSYGCCTWCL